MPTTTTTTTTSGDQGATNATGGPPAGTAAAVRTMMRKNKINGLSIAVVDRDRLRFAAGYGLADRASRTCATASTAYPWFSMTKIVTATAALRLADDGRLDLDAPAGEYLGELYREGGPQPTVRQLLTHTAGLANPLPLRWVHPADAEPPDPRHLLGGLLARRRAFRYPVGERARYSNVGYLAMGEIIGTASGMPFVEYVQRAVLEPVGMHRTGFGHRSGTDRATGYLRAPRIVDPLLRRLLPGGIAGDRDGRSLSLNPFAVDGPAYGGLVGDVLDLGRFLRLHLRDGELDGNRVLAGRTTREMRRLAYPGRPFDHGIGWFRRPTSGAGDWVEHYGAGAGFFNAMRLYPDRGVGVAVMANTTRKYDFQALFEQLAGASWC